MHLRLGGTTLEHLAEGMEKQTGVHVVIPSRLRGRKFIVQADDLTMRAALGAVADLNGWHITVFHEKAVGLDRPSVPDVQQLREIPAALNAILPADFRHFLRVPSILPQGALMHFDTNTDAVTGKPMEIAWERNVAIRKLNRAVRSAEAKPVRILSNARRTFQNTFVSATCADAARAVNRNSRP